MGKGTYRRRMPPEKPGDLPRWRKRGSGVTKIGSAPLGPVKFGEWPKSMPMEDLPVTATEGGV